MIKARLRNRLTDTILDALMLVAIEGPAKLAGLADLTGILQEWTYAEKPDGTARPTCIYGKQQES